MNGQLLVDSIQLLRLLLIVVLVFTIAASTFQPAVILEFGIALQGKYDEANPMYQRALAINETWYGPDHPEVATDLNNWAGLLEKRVRIFNGGSNCIWRGGGHSIALLG